MRLDKFLKVSRILKRRTVAADACDMGKVSVNGRPSKPGHKLKVGDEVQIEFVGSVLKFRVLALNEKANKEEASTLYEIIQ
jgi:ribosomal 50S subunit-recycling heat shock protein